MTLLQIIILILGKMPVFDAITTAFGTAGTGGFGIKNDSLASYNTFCQVVVTIFMILFGVNFNAYFLMISGRFRKALRNSEVITYFTIILVAITIICFDIYNGNIANTVKDAAFQVGSVMTTTGFSTVDFNLWPSVSKTVLVILMFVGACAGSTGGGIKVSRFILLFKKTKRKSIRTAAVLGAINIISFVAEICASTFFLGRLQITVSLVVTACCLSLMIFFIVLAKSKRLDAWVSRKFFM